MRTRAAVALLWTIGWGAACEHRDSSEVLTPASGRTPASERATEVVTRARCQRAERCGRIGENALFDNREHCLNALWPESVAQLTPCRSGVDQSAVQECLSEIDRHGCDDAMSGFAQYPACRVEDLCI